MRATAVDCRASGVSSTPTRARRRQNAHTSPGVGAAAHRARVQVVALARPRRREALVAALEEAEQERGLRARRALLDLVEHLLVAEVAVAGGHRALLDDVVDAAEHAVRGDSRSPSRTSGFTLRTKPARRGQHRVLAAEVARLPAQHVAEQHRGFVVEVVPGREHVVAVVERGVVEQVALRQAARASTARGAWPAAARGTSKPYSPARSTSRSVRPCSRRERARVAARTRRSTRRCRGPT